MTDSKLWPALLRLQGKFGNMARTAENPFYKSRYVPLDELLTVVRPVLTEEGLVLVQAVRVGEGDRPALETELVHVETGERIADSYYLPRQDDPQKFGAAVTYARRYGLKALLGIAEEDDDGNKAAGKGEETPQRANSASTVAPGSTNAPARDPGATSRPKRHQGKERPAPMARKDDAQAVMFMAEQLDGDAAEKGETFRIIKDGKLGVYGKVADNVGIEPGRYSTAQLASRGALPKLRGFYEFLCDKNGLAKWASTEDEAESLPF